MRKAAPESGRRSAGKSWLNAQLRMGTPVAVSQYVSAFTRQGGPAAGPLARVTEKLKT